MTAEVLKNGGSDWDTLIEEFEAEIKKDEEFKASCKKVAAEVSGGSTLC